MRKEKHCSSVKTVSAIVAHCKRCWLQNNQMKGSVIALRPLTQ
jgi:hypothetical protein